MREYTVTMTIETEIEGEAELERRLRAALDNMMSTPYLDYSNLEIEAAEPGEFETMAQANAIDARDVAPDGIAEPEEGGQDD